MRTLLPATLLAATFLAPAAQADIPDHPDALSFPALDFTPPTAAEFRHELSNGVPVYLSPSHEFPLVTVSLSFRGGAYLEPDGLTGLGPTVGALMRRGGTTSMPAEDMDEAFDFLAANVSTYVGADSSGASINALTSNFNDAFGLFMDMVRAPGFDAERLRVHKEQVIEGLKQRNDAPMGVAQLQMSRLVYGDDHYMGRQPTDTTVGAITREEMRTLHRRIFHPGNLIIAVTGDFEEYEMLATLEGAMEGWITGDRASDPPAPTTSIAPGLYHADVAKEELPQGTAFMVSRAVRRDHPDIMPLTVMNHILGGGGFTSRITNRVRSDEGLAYAAGSFLQPQVWFDGVFGAFFMSKNRTVALAAKIVREEMDRIREDEVTQEELETTKDYFIEQFPQLFASKAATLEVFVSDEMTGREAGYWQSYRQRMRSVSAADVLRVAREHVDPKKLAILIVGDWDEIYGGDLEGRASMNDFFDGNVTHLPTLDPLSLEPTGE